MSAANSFDIRFDATLGILRWRLCEFMTVETVHALGAALQEPIARAAAVAPDLAYFTDSSEMPVQSIAVMEALNVLAIRAVEMGRWHAMIANGVLNKLQAERVFPRGPLVGIFRHEAAAYAWLASRRLGLVRPMNAAFASGSASPI